MDSHESCEIACYLFNGSTFFEDKIKMFYVSIFFTNRSEVVVFQREKIQLLRGNKDIIFFSL